MVEASSDALTDTANGEPKVLRVSLADKVHNARSFLQDLPKPDVVESVRSRFSRPLERTPWYCVSLADKFRQRLPSQLADEVHTIVEALDRA
jgi:hypothetical protein